MSKNSEKEVRCGDIFTYRCPDTRSQVTIVVVSDIMENEHGRFVNVFKCGEDFIGRADTVHANYGVLVSDWKRSKLFRTEGTGEEDESEEAAESS